MMNKYEKVRKTKDKMRIKSKKRINNINWKKIYLQQYNICGNINIQ